MLNQSDLVYVIEAHRNKTKPGVRATRKWDGTTPYVMHPIWCASTLLHETSIPRMQREEGSQVLLYHDVLEDTTAELPPWLSDRVKSMVRGMTFNSSEDEWANLWSRPNEIRLFKTYDKTSNLLDGAWMTLDRKEQHQAHLRKIVEDVQRNYGELNILKIARTLL